MHWYHTVLAFFFGVVAVLLMIVILLQRGRGVGLAGAFGGAGGASTFGAKTGDFLTWVTISGAAAVLLFAVILNYVFVPSAPGLSGPPKPAGPTTTAPANNPAPAPSPPPGNNSAPSPPPAPAPTVPPASAPAPDGSWHWPAGVPAPAYAAVPIFGAAA